MSVTPEDLVIPKYPVVRTVDGNQYDHLVVIGDVHGCLDELVDLLYHPTIMETNPDRTLFVLAGDLLDRGPRGAEVVQFVRDAQVLGHFDSVMGNHDDKHVRYRRHLLKHRANPTYKIPMDCPGEGDEAQHAGLSDADCAWLAQRPTAIVVKPHGVIITHAGLVKSTRFRQQTKALIRNRYFRYDSEYKRLQSVKTVVNEKGEFIPPEDAVTWDELWDGPELVVHGHIVHDLAKPMDTPFVVGVDTGCVFGGHLTALVYNLRTYTREFVQVPAERAYYTKKVSC